MTCPSSCSVALRYLVRLHGGLSTDISPCAEKALQSAIIMYIMEHKDDIIYLYRQKPLPKVTIHPGSTTTYSPIEGETNRFDVIINCEAISIPVSENLVEKSSLLPMYNIEAKMKVDADIIEGEEGSFIAKVHKIEGNIIRISTSDPAIRSRLNEVIEK